MQKERILLLAFVLFINVLSSGFSNTTTEKHLAKRLINNCNFTEIKPPIKVKSEFDLILEAEFSASENGRKVLEMGRKMAMIDKTILPGTCWTWADALYKKAGYIKDRQTIHRGKKKGPYADTELIQPGDWLYFINHSYRDSDHSAIFLYWIDKENNIGMTLSYEGQYKRKPGRYKEYNLKDVFYITRPGKA